MTTTQLTPAQHTILAKAIHSSGGKIVWFPDHIKGGARKKVLDGLFNRALITPDGEGWRVAAEGYDALGLPRPGMNKTGIGPFEAHLDRIIANAEGASAAASDPELEQAVATAEASWVKQTKPRTRHNSKQAEVIRMLQRPEGATIAQICAAIGWQAHTVRGTFAGAFKKKLGLTIVSDKPQGGERIYRIA
ncbi:hypothetical protein R1479_04422 [Ralstonia mannitolilytica]|uniref:DUF3489 domain-containing protein n=1 Tax=Ralstonia mannitolilytica TaxID=105219 RepID=A0ABM9KY48_9RALS|nr:DUF3489 domain-containing protein [Ralstonia mannitolilytica]CAJ0888558.1 hypothetical protein R77569_03899 [Ralstonia mannitolilytica]CAJ0899869.1 hypothetical protein R1479_04422 [Ralstonia mannitolilytica]